MSYVLKQLAPALIVVAISTVLLSLPAQEPVSVTGAESKTAVGPGQPSRKYSPQTGAPYIVIDRCANRLYLRTTAAILLEADCSTGTGATLVDSLTDRRWTFDTPEGVFAVTSKLVEPWWRKPDWAFIEEGDPVPEKEAERFDDEMLGAYAIGFGDGYFIHGTLYEGLLGVSVTHGCVRLGQRDLEHLFEGVDLGTRIYIY